MSDADLLVRPVPGANHIAWSLGHLITGNHWMLGALGHQPPPLPEGFAAGYTPETAASDDPAGFAKKAEYLALEDQMKAATLAAIAATPLATLDAPARNGCGVRHGRRPLAAAGYHWMMHAGQFVIVRRKLGKPVMF